MSILKCEMYMDVKVVSDSFLGISEGKWFARVVRPRKLNRYFAWGSWGKDGALFTARGTQQLPELLVGNK